MQVVGLCCGLASNFDQEVVTESSENRAILAFENDDKDQIHDETARQSRWALGIGLTIR